jgi:hypothetical protein
MTTGSGSPDTWTTHPVRRLLRETTVVLARLTLAYAAIPVRVEGGQVSFAIRVLVSALALGGLGLAVRAHLRHSRKVQQPAYVRLELLLAFLYLLVLGFALVYEVTARISPGQFDGVTGRVSALYLSMTVVSTVGMGDVHPTQSVGQLLVTTQMLFDVVYIGTAVRVVTSRAAPVRDVPPRD